jgi:hypothetical protein
MQPALSTSFTTLTRLDNRTRLKELASKRTLEIAPSLEKTERADSGTVLRTGN